MPAEEWLDTAEAAQLLTRLMGRPVNAHMVRRWVKHKDDALEGVNTGRLGQAYYVERMSALHEWRRRAESVLAVVDEEERRDPPRGTGPRPKPIE